MSETDKREYFNNLASSWDELPPMEGAEEKVRRFIGQCASRAPRRVLDVGCGTGLLLAEILRQWPEADCVVELDFALEMLRRNSLKFPDRRVARLCADAARLPLASGSFDVVLCFGILPHLPDQKAALRELIGALRPRGALAVGHLAGSRELNAFHSTLEGPVAGDFLPPGEVLGRMLKEVGAARVEVEEDPGWYFVRAEKA